MVTAKTNNIRAPLIVIGYIVFAVLIISVLLSTTIPFGRIAFEPKVQRLNVIVSAIALTIGSFLPVLIAYIVGDHSVKSKGVVQHHFNGVLFGFLAYWIMTIFGILLYIPIGFAGWSFNTRIIILNIIPSAAVVIVTTILAVAHTRSNKAQHDVLAYVPYQLLLIGSIVLLPLWLLIENVFTRGLSIYSFVQLCAVVVVGVISYMSLRKTVLSRRIKVTWAGVSITALSVFIFVALQLVQGISYCFSRYPGPQWGFVMSIIACICAAIGWVIYWSIQISLLTKTDMINDRKKV